MKNISNIIKLFASIVLPSLFLSGCIFPQLKTGNYIKYENYSSTAVNNSAYCVNLEGPTNKFCTYEEKAGGKQWTGMFFYSTHPKNFSTTPLLVMLNNDVKGKVVTVCGNYDNKHPKHRKTHSQCFMPGKPERWVEFLSEPGEIQYTLVDENGNGKTMESGTLEEEDKQRILKFIDDIGKPVKVYLDRP